jgi:hypothetical protein
VGRLDTLLNDDVHEPHDPLQDAIMIKMRDFLTKAKIFL